MLLLVLLLSAVGALGSGVEELSEWTLGRAGCGDKWLLMLHTTWCQHCHHAQPGFEALAARPGLSFRVGRMDCTQRTALCMELGCSGWPCFVALQGTRAWDYTGADRSPDALAAFVAATDGRDPDRGLVLPSASNLVWRRVRHEAQLVQDDLASMYADHQSSVAALAVLGAAGGFLLGFATRRRRKAKRE
jgi:hypothetical protein